MAAGFRAEIESRGQHGQRQGGFPAELLEQAGYELVATRDDHLCCGSAGTYNIDQPEIAASLGQQKVDETTCLLLGGLSVACALLRDRRRNQNVASHF